MRRNVFTGLVYMQKQGGGIELKAIRALDNDFDKDFKEYPKGDGPTAYGNWKKTKEQAAKQSKKK